MNDPFFFILGNPRSGTSMLRLMLNSHPQMSVPPECGFAQWLYESYKNKDHGSPDVVSAYLADVCKTRKFETWGMDLAYMQAFARNSHPASYAELALLVYQSYAALHGKSARVYGDKNNYYLHHLPELKQAFPDARLVLIVRDGRDVACSYRHVHDQHSDSRYQPDLPTDIRAIAEEWRDNNMAALRMMDDKAITVRYEDLLVAPQEQLARLCEFLGLTFDATMLEYYTHNDEPPEFMAWKGKTLEAPDPENMGKFRNELTQDEIRAYESVAGEVLTRFGYPLES